MPRIGGRLVLLWASYRAENCASVAASRSCERASSVKSAPTSLGMLLPTMCLNCSTVKVGSRSGVHTQLPRQQVINGVQQGTVRTNNTVFITKTSPFIVLPAVKASSVRATHCAPSASVGPKIRVRLARWAPLPTGTAVPSGTGPDAGHRRSAGGTPSAAAGSVIVLHPCAPGGSLHKSRRQQSGKEQVRHQQRQGEGRQREGRDTAVSSRHSPSGSPAAGMILLRRVMSPEPCPAAGRRRAAALAAGACPPSRRTAAVPRAQLPAVTNTELAVQCPGHRRTPQVGVVQVGAAQAHFVPVQQAAPAAQLGIGTPDKCSGPPAPHCGPD